MALYNLLKQPGGTFTPASDLEADRLNRFKTGEVYEVEIKQPRNPAFHSKTFAFLNFCFEHWRGTREFLSEKAQFDEFRENLTILAGYYDEVYDLQGNVTLKAKSLSYGSMNQEEFEHLYHALVTAASKHLFGEADDETFNKLMSFFH